MAGTLALDRRMQEIEMVSFTDVVKSTSHPEKISVAVKLAGVVRNIGNTSKEMLNNSKRLPVVGVLKLTAIALIPLTIYEIASSIFSVVKTSFNEKLDIALNVISNLGSLLDITGTIAEGLSAIKVVAKSAVHWAGPLGIVATVIESVGMALKTKNLIETERFSKIFKETAGLDLSDEEYSLENYKKARELVAEKHSQEKTFVSKHLSTDGEKLNERLLAIESEAKEFLASNNLEDVLKGKNKLKTTMQSLSQRMTTKKWSTGLSLLASTISIIGFGLLFSPLPPVGMAFLALSSILSIINLFMQKAQTKSFEKGLGI